MLKRIHVNQARIRSNAKNGTADAVIIVRTSRGVVYGSQVEILGPSKLVYSPHKPLSCGARLWLETTAEVLVDGKPECAGGTMSRGNRERWNEIAKQTRKCALCPPHGGENVGRRSKHGAKKKRKARDK